MPRTVIGRKINGWYLSQNPAPLQTCGWLFSTRKRPSMNLNIHIYRNFKKWPYTINFLVYVSYSLSVCACLLRVLAPILVSLFNEFQQLFSWQHFREPNTIWKHVLYSICAEPLTCHQPHVPTSSFLRSTINSRIYISPDWKSACSLDTALSWRRLTTHSNMFHHLSTNLSTCSRCFKLFLRD